ncbi:thiaminase II [Bacillus sp. JCM 19046]|uniref:Aminopyrimidine aminohydrolase n=1 Tax=Shouchella xiaoxiensis TaxID=766895 RepID=A0ABS2ST69_9BACI|nr:thiaminase II [Shouchella xiaoxiensis]MBM7838733.1 thiaminase/transcriptional activator TenA [Shouchella xiaoxiensis]GAF11887.1 thiaminase II [Bacillus sp. JCM 19045]GAF16182.1 thiaminase II [Bacillus sp. JCM 19046]
MTFSKRIRERADSIWAASHQHPFVQGIGHGTLPLDSFKYYMRQDYKYLIDYARVMALGSVLAPDLNTMSGFAKALDETLNTEMELHRSYAARLGISRQELEETVPGPVTLAYSGVMMAEAQKGSIAELIASILPCAWSYYEIGTELAKIPGATEHEYYGEWVKMYASKEFGAIAEWLIETLDGLAESKSEEELNRIEQIFLNTSRYEYMFWDMAYHQQSWPVE